jgi:hypothetical protein
MSTAVTTYLVEGREIGIKFLFKYNLNGLINSFNVVGDEMNDKQVDWLFKLPEGALYPRFPAKEAEFKERWINDKAMQKKFTITEEPPDLSWEAMWELYDHKRSRKDSIKSYEKLAKDRAELIKCFAGIPKYNKWFSWQGKHAVKLHLSTYINQARYEDEYPEQFTTPKKEPVIKSKIPALHDLANKKTEK